MAKSMPWVQEKTKLFISLLSWKLKIQAKFKKYKRVAPQQAILLKAEHGLQALLENVSFKLLLLLIQELSKFQRWK